MKRDAINFFKFKKSLRNLGYFETEENNTLIADLKATIYEGGLIIVAGIVGAGKTTTLHKVQSELNQAKDIIVSQSCAIDKDKVNLSTLMEALYCDLATEKKEFKDL